MFCFVKDCMGSGGKLFGEQWICAACFNTLLTGGHTNSQLYKNVIKHQVDDLEKESEISNKRVRGLLQIAIIVLKDQI